MLQAVYQRFAGSCMMLMHGGEGHAYFSGTAFLVHKRGYLLCAEDAVEPAEDLLAVPANAGSAFVDVTMEEVTPIPLELVRSDPEHGIALLRIVPEMEIAIPYHILGNPERTEIGSTLMSLGFAFGHNRLHNLATRHAVLSSKILTPAGTKLLLFDRLLQDGDRGGPLLDAQDSRIIGMNLGRFDPVDFRREEHAKDAAVAPSLSYALSIEYGIDLLEAEGLEVT